MPFKEIIKLTLESFGMNKLRAVLTMLGVIVGVGAVVLLVSVGEGAKRYITEEFEGLGTNIILVNPGKSSMRTGIGPPRGATRERITQEDVEAVRRESYNLMATTGLIMGSGTLKGEDRSKTAAVIGANETFNRILNIKMLSGRFLSAEEEISGRRVVVLGYAQAENFFGDTNPLGKLVKINDSAHRVVGTLKRAGDTLGFNLDELAIVPTKSAMRIFNTERLDGIRARAKSKESIDDAVEEIGTILTRRHNGQEDFTIVTKVSMMDTLNTILEMLTYVLGGIAMISLLVGGIGIMNIMLVSVTERTREIGVRRAVGARKIDVLKQFLVEAVLLSVFGGIIGLLGSVTLTYLISYLVETFDMSAPLWVTIVAFAISLITGVTFGVWPAKKAASIEPIEALRTE